MLAASTASGARWMKKFWRERAGADGGREIDVTIWSFFEEDAREERMEGFYI